MFNLITLFVLTFSSAKEEIVFFHPQVDAIDAQAWISQHDEIMQYRDKVIEGFKTTAEKIDVSELYFKARQKALQGQVRQAREKFVEITELALMNHWSPAQRDFIYQSILHLAELSDSKFEKTLWTQRATEYFPWKNSKTDYPIKWRPHERFSDFQYIVVNGQIFDIGPDLEIQLPSAQYLVSFVSSSYEMVTRKIHSDSLANIQIERIPFLNGSCETPSLKDSIGKHGTLLFFSSDCVLAFRNGEWTRYQNQDIYPRLSGVVGEKLTVKKINKKWQWITVAALSLAAGYAIYDHNRPREVKRVVVESEE